MSTASSPATSIGAASAAGRDTTAPAAWWNAGGAGTVATDAAQADLITAVRKGDRDAMNAFVQQHYQLVYAYLRARLLEASDAEDLSQEVFLRCLTQRGKLHREIRLPPWLIGIARNVLREHVRRVRRRRETAWTEMCLELDELAESGDAGQDEALNHLPKCLDSLGDSAREALRLRYGGELKLAEIGEKLSRSEGAVKLLMYRARQALRRCIDHRMGSQS